MKDTGRGYDLPYAVDTGTRLGLIACMSVITVLWTAYGLWELVRNPEAWVLLLPGPLLMLLTVQAVLELKATLHLVPEGIAVTAFGKVLRRFPEEKIRFLAAVPGNKNNDRMPRIAVCDYSQEDLTALGAKKIPSWVRTAHEVWPGEFAGKYLTMCGTMSLFGEMNLQKNILWLDWDPERLQLLRQMYPHAQWLDCTRDKMFERLLTQRENSNEN